MLGIVLLNLLMVSWSFAGNPIVILKPSCPVTMTGVPILSLISDIPARAMAHCMNGDSPLTTTNNVHFSLSGTFGPLAFTEDCLFHQNGSTGYFVDVEVSWAERSRQKVEHHEVHTVSCIYDDQGLHVPSTGSKDHWFVAPKTPVPTEAKPGASAPLSLKILDERGSEIFSRIVAGRRIKLVAEGNPGSRVAFHAVSCEATNGVTSQNVLESGCGDGSILGKSEGFHTVGDKAVSPYFKAFNLPGGQKVTFNCKFTACHTACDEDSYCARTASMVSVAGSLGDQHRDIITASFVSVTSGPVFLNPLR